MDSIKKISPAQETELIEALQARFERNMARHQGLQWAAVRNKLGSNAEKLWSLREMERTWGEPDVAGYDREALESRKENRPEKTRWRWQGLRVS